MLHLLFIVASLTEAEKLAGGSNHPQVKFCSFVQFEIILYYILLNLIGLILLGLDAMRLGARIQFF